MCTFIHYITINALFQEYTQIEIMRHHVDTEESAISVINNSYLPIEYSGIISGFNNFQDKFIPRTRNHLHTIKFINNLSRKCVCLSKR